MKWRPAIFQRKEFSILTVKMTQDLWNRIEAKIEKIQEMFTKDIKEQTEMSNTQEGIHNRITEIEAWINDLEERKVEITATEQNIEKNKNAKK